MIRIDRAKFEAGTRLTMETVALRFDDLDFQNHVNNAAAVVLLQEARVRFNSALGLPILIDGLRTVVAALQVEYAGEILYPGTVEIGTGVLGVGRSSFTLGQIGRQDGAPRLYAEAVMVIVGDSGPVPVPPGLREAYERHLIG